VVKTPGLRDLGSSAEAYSWPPYPHWPCLCLASCTHLLGDDLLPPFDSSDHSGLETQPLPWGSGRSEPGGLFLGSVTPSAQTPHVLSPLWSSILTTSHGSAVTSASSSTQHRATGTRRFSANDHIKRQDHSHPGQPPPTSSPAKATLYSILVTKQVPAQPLRSRQVLGTAGPCELEQRELGGQKEEGGREGTGRSCRALWAAGRTWTLALREVGAMEGCGKGREGLARRSRAPSVAEWRTWDREKGRAWGGTQDGGMGLVQLAMTVEAEATGRGRPLRPMGIFQSAGCRV
jgi:hypothetical protein